MSDTTEQTERIELIRKRAADAMRGKKSDLANMREIGSDLEFLLDIIDSRPIGGPQ